jgi:glucose-6-phosphate isomerase
MSTPRDQSPSWKALAEHYNKIKAVHMRDLFHQDPQRFAKFHLQLNDILFDFSKNIITNETLELLLKVIDEVHLKEWIEKMFTGEKINITENRAVLHVALRNRSNTPILVDGKDVMPEVRLTAERSRRSDALTRAGERRAAPHERLHGARAQWRMDGVEWQAAAAHCEHWHRWQ